MHLGGVGTNYDNEEGVSIINQLKHMFRRPTPIALLLPCFLYFVSQRLQRISNTPLVLALVCHDHYPDHAFGLSAAGTDLVNGIYEDKGIQINDVPSYTYENNTMYRIKVDNTLHWVIAGEPITETSSIDDQTSEALDPLIYYRAPSTYASLNGPPTDGWIRNTGDDPVPELLFGLDGCKANSFLKKQKSQWDGNFSWFSNIPNILAPALYGGLSDRFGRKAIILLEVWTLIICYIVEVIIAFVLPPVQWLISGKILEGIAGKSGAISLIYFAYVADCVQSHQKTQYFAAIYASRFLGEVVGPYLGGILFDIGRFVPYFIAVAGLVAVFLLHILIPESLAEENRTKALEVKHVNVFSSLAIFGKNSSWVILAIIFSLGKSITDGTDNVIQEYQFFKFHWSDSEAGLWRALYGLGRVACLILILPLILWMIRSWNIWSNMFCLRVSLLVTAIGGFSLGFSPQGWVQFVGVWGWAFAGFFDSVISPMYSNATEADAQGRVMAALGTIHGIANIAAEPAFDEVYKATVDTTPAAIWYCIGGAAVMGFILSLFVLRRHFESLQQIDTKKEPLLKEYGTSGGPTLVINGAEQDFPFFSVPATRPGDFMGGRISCTTEASFNPDESGRTSRTTTDGSFNPDEIDLPIYKPQSSKSALEVEDMFVSNSGRWKNRT